MKFCVYAIALPMLLFASQSAYAQSVNDQAEESSGQEIILSEPSDEDYIVVSAGLLGRPPADRTSNVDVISRPNQGAGQSVEGMLRSIAGLQQFRRSDSRSANASSQGVTMRGLGGNASSRSIVLLDGIPQADPFGGWIAWTALDAVELRGIRVLHGGGGGADGAGALAGSLSLSSDSWPDQDASISAGSYGSIDADAHIGARLGAGIIALNGNYGRSDGFIPILAGQRGAVDHMAMSQHQGIGLRSVFDAGDSTKIENTIRWFSDKRDRGLPFSVNKNSGADASIRILNNAYDSLQYSILAYAQLRNFASQAGSVNADRSMVTPTLDQYDVPSTGLGARFELRPHLGDAFELRLGGDWRRTQGATHENSNYINGLATRNRIAGGKSDTIGAFAEASWDITSYLQFSASGRLDKWWLSEGRRVESNIGGAVRSDDHFADRSDTESTGRVGFAYTGFSGFKLHGGAYIGWRLPTLNELYRPFRIGLDATAANELLNPERLRGGELGADYGSGDTVIKLTAYWNRINGAIANVSEGNGPGTFAGVGVVSAGGVYRRRENLDAINAKGIELSAKQGLGDFSLSASYAYVDARVIASGIASSLNGLRPAQVPKHSGSISAAWTGAIGSHKSNAQITARYLGAQYEDDANSRTLASAITLDMIASIGLTDTITFDLRGENIFDARVETAISNTGIIEISGPRTIWAGLRFVIPE